MVTVYLTDKKIPFNELFIKKLDLMIERITQKNPKLDAVFQNEGGEGLGKTSFSIAQAYYISYKIGIPFSEKNVFVDLKKAIDFAKNTEKQIVIFDEPAKGLLKMQWRNQLQQQIIELLMIARKKRHFIIFNFVKFYKFNEYIVVDRCLGMAHLYERRDRKGYAFAYIPRDRLEDLYNDAIKKHQRNYFKYSVFTGEFPDVLNPDKEYNILDSFDVEAYEKEKDRVISTIGDNNKPEKVVDERAITAKLIRKVREINPNLSHLKLSELFGIPKTTIFRYLKDDKDNFDGEVSQTGSFPPIIRNTGT